MINPFGIITTVGLFKIIQKYNKIPILRAISPILITGIVIILILKLFRIDYKTYQETASWLTFLLIPATISLGYPLYENINILIKNKRVVYSAFLVAALIALISTFFVGKICGTDGITLISMLPKSVTAPIAVEISKCLHGIPELTACVVCLTGVFGAVMGHKILKILRIKSDIAIGLAIGAASHVLGTSKCIETGRQKQVVMSTISLIIVGILTVIFAPIIFRLCHIFL